jgi:hypothetical protein
MRYRVPSEFTEWWGANIPPGRYEIRLQWRGGNKVRIAQLSVGTTALRVSLAWTNGPHRNGNDAIQHFCEGGSRMQRILGQVLARAGWQRPRIDPAAMERLLALRTSRQRLEFVLDTNAMVEGVAQWLVDVFADKCDLVVTAVSLRELQDQVDRAKFREELPAKVKERSQVLAARQVYLAANRLREQTAYEGVLWRELAIDDTALLLSRGRDGSKSSESDTMLLRAVRRSILDRVNGLERFFVTGDVALARRATSELPAGSVVAARVRDVEDGSVYLPCSWWPGPDQGHGTVRSVPRLIWELLAVADSVEVDKIDGGTPIAWSFEAHDSELWPSDYASPWVRIQPFAPEPAVAPPIARQTFPVPAVSAVGRRAPTEPKPSSGELKRRVWAKARTEGRRFDKNLRVAADTVLDALAAIVTAGPIPFALPAACVRSDEQAHHIQELLTATNIATVTRNGSVETLLPSHDEFVAAWTANDRDRLFDLLRVWEPLNEWATLDVPPARPPKTQESARGLAQRLGQGMRVESQWVRGGLRPDAETVRAALVGAVEALPQGPQGLPVYTMLVDVFLRVLGVAPPRVSTAWQRLNDAGAFAGFEFRAGGTSSGRRTVEIARFSEAGWASERLDLETVHGYRDLLFRRVDRV